MRMKGITSSDIPNIAPPSENRIIKIGISKVLISLCFLWAFTIDRIPSVTASVF
ncbi:hypothetical protein BMS3Abin04_00792 [bacterium BMS3Abin04]|nr:hypothetical protein BMS3Abin04_00792 [bacterium BMS3Abin04]